MTTTYPSLYRFTEEGIRLFERVMTGQISETAVELNNPLYVQAVAETNPLEIRSFSTAKDMASGLIPTFGAHVWQRR